MRRLAVVLRNVSTLILFFIDFNMLLSAIKDFILPYLEKMFKNYHMVYIFGYSMINEAYYIFNQ